MAGDGDANGNDDSNTAAIRNCAIFPSALFWSRNRGVSTTSLRTHTLVLKLKDVAMSIRCVRSYVNNNYSNSSE